MEEGRGKFMTIMGVKNGRTIRLLSGKEYRGNIKKNLMTVIAISMTTFLIMVVFSLGISYYTTLTERSVAAEGMKYDVLLPEPTEEQVQKAHKIEGVVYAGLAVKCAVIDEYEGKNTRIRLFWADQECWEKQCLPAFEMVEGKYPETENEIMLSTVSLSEMGIDTPEVGMKVAVKWGSLSEESDLKDRESTFRLSGYYKDFNRHSNGYVSKVFYDKTGVKQTDLTNGNLYLTLKNPLYSNMFIKEVGEQLDLYGNQVINSDPYLLINFAKMMGAVIFLTLLILASGYLFIYNILYISIAKAIRSYGQLKTIGMTGTQMKSYMLWQIIWNVIIGIPIGLLLGGVVALRIVPVIMAGLSHISEAKQVVAFHPILLICAAAFALLVVWLGSSQLMKKVAMLTPIAAMRFTGISEKKRQRKSEKNMTIFHMGLWNILRNKKQLIISALSLLVVMTTVLIVSVILEGNSTKTVLHKMYSYDARILNSELIDRPDYQGITEKTVDSVSEISGVKGIRKVYSQQIIYDYNESFKLFEEYFNRVYSLSLFSKNQYEQDMKEWKENPDNYQGKGRIVGIDENQFKILNEQAGGKLDRETFLNGEGAILSGFMGTSAKEVVGKQLGFQVYGENSKSAVQIKWELNELTDSPHALSGGMVPDIIVSEQLYKELVSNPILELIYMDYENAFDDGTDRAIQNLIGSQKDLDLSLKTSLYDQMYENETQLRVLGNSLCIILAVMAFMNYGNMTAIGIQNRKKELATMQSIGMTRGQQKNMMIAEGAGYAGISVICSLVIGLPLSYLMSQVMNSYQTPYQFPAIQNILFVLLMFGFCCGIPVVLYNVLQKGNIVELMKGQ